MPGKLKLIFILTSFIFIFLNEGSFAQEIKQKSDFENRSADLNYIFTGGTEGYSTFRIPAIVTLKSRKISFSDDGGLNWSDIQSDNALIEPICQASLLFTEVNKTLWFTNPANETSRTNMTLKASHDFGETWEIVKILNSGASAYSDLTLINAETLGILYEGGKTNPYEGIVFTTFEIN